LTFLANNAIREETNKEKTMSGYSIEFDDNQKDVQFKYTPEMPEEPSLLMKMEYGRQGNSTETFMRLDFRGGIWEGDGDENGVTIKCSGDWERRGLIRALEYAVAELKKAG
jgi:hypothetical protein